MMAQGIFLFGMLTLILFNVLGFAVMPAQDVTYHFIQMTLGGVIFTVSAAIVTLGVLGVHATVEAATFGAGYSLSDYSIQVLFGSAVILGILFSLNVGYGLQIGLGLATNAVSFFKGGDVLGIGSLVCNVLGVVTLIAGVMSISGGD